MKLVFLAGPFRGDGSTAAKEKNVATAREYARKLIAAEIPYYSPHLNVSEESIALGEAVDEFANSINAYIFEACSILAVLPEWETSSGTEAEVARAKEREIPIVYLESPDSIEKLKNLVTE